MCGTIVTLSSANKAGLMVGSPTNTSSPARKIVRLLSASISAGSSTTEPRATLIKMPRRPVDEIVGCRPTRQDGDQGVDIAGHGDEVAVIAVGQQWLLGACIVADRPAEGLEAAGNGAADAPHTHDADAAVAQRGRGQSIVALSRPAALA